MILGLPTRDAITLGVVGGFLALATVIVLLKRALRPGSGDQSLWDRTRAWWVMVLLLSAALFAGRGVTTIFFALVSFGALKEFLTLIPLRSADRRVMFWAYAAIPVQYLLIRTGSVGIFTVFIPVYMFMIIPMRMISIGETRGFVRAAAITQWALMGAVYGLGHTAALLYLRGQGTASVDVAVTSGQGLLLFLLIVTQMNDVAAFCTGKLIGGPKIIPSVSPNKTWAGFIGGIVTTTALGAVLGPLLTPMRLDHALLAGLGIGIFGFFGDATLSAVKRDLGVKDAGSIIPGHGGVLDRVNSLMFTAPLFFHFIRFFYF